MEISRTKEILGQFGKHKVLVLGDVLLDHYVHGKVERLNPEAPVPVLLAREEYERTGGAGNVAKNTAELGIETVLLSVVGDDDLADNVKQAAEKENYTAKLIRDPSRPTIRKTRHIADSKVEGQQLLRVDTELTHDISGDVEQQLIDTLTIELAKGVDGVIVSDYAKGVVTSRVAQALLDLAGQMDILVAADVKPGRSQCFTGSTLISPNLKEAHEYVGLNQFEGQVEPDKLARMVYMKTCSDVFLTMGADGMYVYCGGETGTHIQQKAKAIDPSGAGDTVIAVLLPAMLGGANSVESAELANAAGGIVVGKVGSVGLTVAELEEALAEDEKQYEKSSVS